MSAENLVALILALSIVLFWNFEDFFVFYCEKKKINIKTGSVLYILTSLLFLALLFLTIAFLIPDLVFQWFSRAILPKIFGFCAVFCFAEFIIGIVTDLILKRGVKNV